MKRCPYCKSSDITAVRCESCGEVFDTDDRHGTVVSAIYSLMDELAGEFDDDARLTVLDELIHAAITIRAKLEGGDDYELD